MFYCVPDRCVPERMSRIFHPLDNASLRYWVPWTMRPVHDAPLRRRVSGRCVLTLLDTLTLCWDRLDRTVEAKPAIQPDANWLVTTITFKRSRVGTRRSGTRSPRETSSKGRIVQGTHCSRDGTSETFRSGTDRHDTTHSHGICCSLFRLLQVYAVGTTVLYP